LKRKEHVVTAVTVDEVVADLRARRDPKALAGMARYGIRIDAACGVSIPELRALGKRILAELGRRDPARHTFALGLWATGIHDARLLAGMVDLAEMVTVDQMDAWVLDLDSWDVCDQVCNNLFVDTPFAWDKALEWSERAEEFVKRAGFALMACLAVRMKDAPDERFLPLLAAIEREAADERNYVKKAVNWALRQIGKRNPALHAQAVTVARRIAASGSRSGRWVASDALRELQGEVVGRKLGL
jgi:3-methyladenine DNA glycosylase AlkD